MLLLCCATVYTSQAGGNASSDKELVDLLSKIKTADGYCYNVKVVSQVLGDNKSETMKMTNYQSRDQFVIYTKSDDAFFFLCRNGQFRVNVKEKTVYYHQFDSTAELTDLQKEWSAPLVGGLVDSFFLLNAKIAEKKKDKKTTHYKLKYTEDSGLKETNVTYNLQTSFFSTISYSFQRTRVFPGNKTVVIKQDVTMDNYRKKAPEDLQSLISDTKNMLAYLQNAYKGYVIKPI